MDYQNVSTKELLYQLFPKQQINAVFRGSITLLCCRPHYSARMMAAKEIVKRWLAEEMLERVTLSSPHQVREYLTVHFGKLEHESFVGLFLNAQNGLIAIEELSRGTLTQTSVYPREVVKRTLYFNAASVMFAHNHPSGTSEPSSADRHLTRALKEALTLVDVKVLDHFIVAGGTILSFAERGLI